MFYPKIDTLFDRGEDFNVDLTRYRRPEFAYVDKWLWMEKLDGANISIIATRNHIEWRGRTAKANFTPEIQNHLNMRIEAWHTPLQEVLGAHKLDSIEFFGEVYGPRIQNGGIYRDDINTKFYDIRINGHLWLDWNAILNYGDKLDYDVPEYSIDITENIVASAQDGFHTFEHEVDGQLRRAEGFVAKTPVPLYNNAGKRLIWKIKHSDFTHGKNK